MGEGDGVYNLLIILDRLRERPAKKDDLATARNRDLLNADTADNLCAVCLFRLVVENEQALAGEPPGDGAGPRPHAGILIILSDKGYLARDFPVFVAVLDVVCAAFAGYGVLRDSFRGEERPSVERNTTPMSSLCTLLNVKPNFTR